MGSAATDIILESKRSRKKNKGPVHGVGIIDVPFSVRGTVDGKKIYHRAFNVWNSILQRCYYPPIQAKYPSYIGCSVSPEWLLFSGFLKWWKANFHEGWEIDKDLLFPRNKIYSPDKQSADLPLSEVRLMLVMAFIGQLSVLERAKSIT